MIRWTFCSEYGLIGCCFECSEVFSPSEIKTEKLGSEVEKKMTIIHGPYEINMKLLIKRFLPQKLCFLKNSQINRVTNFISAFRSTESDSAKIGLLPGPGWSRVVTWILSRIWKSDLKVRFESRSDVRNSDIYWFQCDLTATQWPIYDKPNKVCTYLNYHLFKKYGLDRGWLYNRLVIRH